MSEVHGGLDALPASFGPSVVTIGNFDGVHMGHRKILTRCVEQARARSASSVAVIFDPHPLRVVAPDRAPLLMTTPEERAERFAELGVDAVLILPFNDALRNLSPEAFVARVLVKKLAALQVVVGRNFRFGRRHAGNIDTLRELGAQYGFETEAVDEQRNGGRVISSSAVRAAVASGRLSEARRLLGSTFRLRGGVIAGRGVGSKQTVPTLNLRPDTELLPADGVYISRTRSLDGPGCWRSVTNVGVRPTFGDSDRVVETHLLDPLEGPAPGRIEIRFKRRLRPERKFDRPETLRAQILADIGRAERYFRLLESL